MFSVGLSFISICVRDMIKVILSIFNFIMFFFQKADITICFTLSESSIILNLLVYFWKLLEPWRENLNLNSGLKLNLGYYLFSGLSIFDQFSKLHARRKRGAGGHVPPTFWQIS